MRLMPIRTQRREHLQPALGELAPCRRDERVLDRGLIRDVDALGQVEVRGEVGAVAGRPGVERLELPVLDVQVARVAACEPGAGVVVRDVVAHELVDGLAHVREQLHVGVHLLLRGVLDRVERALDQVGDEDGKRDRAQGLARHAGDLARGGRLEVLTRGGLGGLDRRRAGADHRPLLEPLGLVPVVPYAFREVGADVDEPVREREAVLRREVVEARGVEEQRADDAAHERDRRGMRLEPVRRRRRCVRAGERRRDEPGRLDGERAHQAAAACCTSGCRCCASSPTACSQSPAVTTTGSPSVTTGSRPESSAIRGSAVASPLEHLLSGKPGVDQPLDVGRVSAEDGDDRLLHRPRADELADRRVAQDLDGVARLLLEPARGEQRVAEPTRGEVGEHGLRRRLSFRLDPRERARSATSAKRGERPAERGEEGDELAVDQRARVVRRAGADPEQPGVELHAARAVVPLVLARAKSSSFAAAA